MQVCTLFPFECLLFAFAIVCCKRYGIHVHVACVDGHEREEQRARRAAYLQHLNTLWHRTVKNEDIGKLLQRPAGTTFTVAEQAALGCTLRDVAGADGTLFQESPVVILYHDESTFYRQAPLLPPSHCNVLFFHH